MMKVSHPSLSPTSFERGYIFLAAIFLAALVACNLTVYKFFYWDGFGLYSFILSVGILPYPVTFLVTDIVSEIYGEARANLLVVAGFFASIFVLLFLQLGMSTTALHTQAWRGDWTSPPAEIAAGEVVVQVGAETRRIAVAGYPGGEELVRWSQDGLSFEFEIDDLGRRTGRGRFAYRDPRPMGQDPVAILSADPLPGLAQGVSAVDSLSPISDVGFRHTFGGSLRAIIASMIAHLCAQFLDVKLFHFWRRLTKGRHLWLRNNGSTIFSQIVDTTLVVTILFIGDPKMEPQIPAMIASGALFKVSVALLDTPFFYLAAWWFKRRFPDQCATD